MSQKSHLHFTEGGNSSFGPVTWLVCNLTHRPHKRPPGTLFSPSAGVLFTYYTQNWFVILCNAQLSSAQEKFTPLSNQKNSL